MTREQIIDNRKKFSAALRSGEWKQAKGLYVGSEPRSYCALGLAGHILGMDDMEIKSWRVTEPLGLNHFQFEAIRRANDDRGKSFPEIADMVDALPEPE